MLDGTTGGGGGAGRGDDAGGGYLAPTAFNVVAATIAEGWDDGEGGVGEGGRKSGSASGRHVAVVKVAKSRRSLQPMGQGRECPSVVGSSAAIRRSLQS